jgi:Sigma-70, region 4
MTTDPDIRAMAEALNRIDQYASLGRVSLAQGRAVNAELTRLQLNDTPFQRGRILSRFVRDEVRRQFQRRKQDGAGRDVAEWTILYLRVQEGLSLRQIGERLHIPLRSVARYYARAKELLLDRLYALDEGQITAGVYCPLCGTRADAAREDLPTSSACSGCGAELDVELDSESTFHVLARQPRRSE